MCGRCDEAYYRYMRREEKHTLWPVLVVLVAIGTVPVMISMAMLPLTISTVFFGFPAALWWRGRQDRRRFFTLMRERAALPDASPAVSAEAEALAAYERKLDDRRAEVFVASFGADQ